MIASKIQLYDSLISVLDWNFFLRGGSGSAELPEKVPSFVTEKIYKDIFDLSNLTAPFKSLLKDLLSPENEETWKKIIHD